jgi:hypothetical protein
MDLAVKWYNEKLSGLEEKKSKGQMNNDTVGDTREVILLPSLSARLASKIGDWLSIRKPFDEWAESMRFTQDNIGERVEDERRHRHALKKAELPRPVIAAICGGALLVAPMLIMAIHPSKTKSLATSSTFVFVFGLGLAFFSASKVSELLAATAVYVAVLVVFVGVSGS